MKRSIALVLSVFCLAAAWGSLQQHERLRMKNSFKSPEDVVRYYCSRDASGFVWSGLLESERKAFTAWSEAPQQDTFYIARKYEVMKAKETSRDLATVDVRYELTGFADAQGNRKAVNPRERLVSFNLKRIAGSWKIVKPDFSEISPIVLEEKFPITN